MATTSTKRSWWAAYVCQKSGRFPEMSILGRPKTKVNPLMVEGFLALDHALRASGYVSSFSADVFSCRQITGGSGYSLHAYGIAIDIDAQVNPYYGSGSSYRYVTNWSRTRFTKPQIDAVYAIRTNNGKQLFIWGGYFRTVKDYMHFEVDVSPFDVKSGINWNTVRGYQAKDDTMIIRQHMWGNHIRLWKKALNEANRRNNMDLPLLDELHPTFDEPMRFVVSRYQRAAGIHEIVPEIGALDDYTRDLLNEFIRDDT